MHFGLCAAPTTFERMIDSVLRGLKWPICLCYLDDIVVFDPNFAIYLERLKQALICLKGAGLQLNLKCRFTARWLTMLCHVVSKDGILPDHEVEGISSTVFLTQLNCVLSPTFPNGRQSKR